MLQQEPVRTASAGSWFQCDVTAKPGRTHHIDEVSPLTEVEDSPHSLYHVSAGTVAPICTTVKVNGASLKTEVDTGASLSLINEATYRNLW